MEVDCTRNKKIKEVECHLNNACNKTIGDTPFHILYGYYVYYPNFTDGTLRHSTSEDAWEDTNQLRNKVLRLNGNINYGKKNTIRNIQNQYSIEYSVGEVVYIQRPVEVTGESTKLQVKYRRPLVITTVLPYDIPIPSHSSTNT